MEEVITLKKFLKTAKGRIAVIGAAAAAVTAAVLIFVLSKGETAYRSISLAEVSGSVITENNGQSYEAYKNMVLSSGYSLSTEESSYARMLLDSDKYMKLEEKSRAVFKNLGNPENHQTVINLDYGALSSEITRPLKDGETFVVNTPNAVLAVRGTFFRAAVSFDNNGDAYTDVSVYGGTVVCRRIMPDGTEVDEEVLIEKGYKALIKMDEIITVYVEEFAELEEDDVDPLEMADVHDDQLVDVYNASANGHEMFRTSGELWDEIVVRDIDLNKYTSAYDGGEIPIFDGDAEQTTAPASRETEASETEATEPTSAQTEAQSEEQTEASDTEAETAETAAAYTSANTELSADNANAADNTDSSDDDTGEITNLTRQSAVAVDSAAENQPSELPAPTASTYSSPSESGELPPHVHSEMTERIDAGCTESGYIRVYCSECGEILSETEIPALGHSETTRKIDSTCTENGSVTVVCKICGTVISSETIPASGHKIQAVTVLEPGCESEGLQQEICSVCGEIAAHNKIPALGHNSKWTTAQEPSCMTDGLEQESCTRCGMLLSVRALPASGHHEVSERAEPTCTENGSVTVMCGDCGTVLSREEIPAKGHSAETRVTTEPGCDFEGLEEEVCKSCGLTLSSRTLPALGHIAGESVRVEASCGKEGSVTVSCSRCGKIMSQETIPPLEHILVEENIAPTCTENGRNTVKCSLCGEVISEEIIDALGHTEVTVMEGNAKIVKCSVCGLIISSTVITEGVAVDEVNFPDETFREYVSENFDTDNDGCLSEAECGTVTYIYVGGWGVTSLKGIEYFERLSVLHCFDNAGLTGFDVSHNTELTELHCQNTPITELDVSNNKKLQNLRCHNTLINKLDVSNNTQLTDLQCNDTSISELDLTNNSMLMWLDCSNAKLAYIDVSKCSSNISVYAQDNKYNVRLIDGAFDTKLIKGFDPSRAGDFYEEDYDAVWDSETGILSAIVDGTTEITYYYDCGGEDNPGKINRFTFVVDESSTFMPDSKKIPIDETNFPDEVFREYVINHFDMNRDSMLSRRERDMAERIELSAYFDENSEGSLSLKGIEYLGKLTELELSADYILNLDMGKSSSLTSLRCDVHNSDADIDLSGYPLLTDLFICGDRITSVNLTGNRKLASLQIECCYALDELDLSCNMELTALDCFDVELLHLDLSRCTKLTAENCHIDCRYGMHFAQSEKLIPSNVKYIYLSEREEWRKIDVSRIIEIKGASYDSKLNAFVVDSPPQPKITYTYDCGNGIIGTFNMEFCGEPIEGKCIDEFWNADIRRTVLSFDSNKDGYISAEEAAAVREIRITLTESSDGYGYDTVYGVLDVDLNGLSDELGIFDNLKTVRITVPNSNNASRLRLIGVDFSTIAVSGASYDSYNDWLYNITGTLRFSWDHIFPDNPTQYYINLS